MEPRGVTLKKAGELIGGDKPLSVRVYTIAEVCAMLDCSRSTVHTLIRKRALISPVRGKVTIASVEKLLERGQSWHEDPKAKAPNGAIKRRVTGAGASGTRTKRTTSTTLTARGRGKNAIS